MDKKLNYIFKKDRIPTKELKRIELNSKHGSFLPTSLQIKSNWDLDITNITIMGDPQLYYWDGKTNENNRLSSIFFEKFRSVNFKHLGPCCGQGLELEFYNQGGSDCDIEIYLKGIELKDYGKQVGRGETNSVLIAKKHNLTKNLTKLSVSNTNSNFRHLEIKPKSLQIWHDLYGSNDDITLLGIKNSNQYEIDTRENPLSIDFFQEQQEIDFDILKFDEENQLEFEFLVKKDSLLNNSSLYLLMDCEILRNN